MTSALLTSTAVRNDLDTMDRRPAWAAIARAVGDDAADIIERLPGCESDLIDFACRHDCGGNFVRTYRVTWDGSALMVTDPRSGASEVLFER